MVGYLVPAGCATLHDHRHGEHQQQGGVSYPAQGQGNGEKVRKIFIARNRCLKIADPIPATNALLSTEDMQTSSNTKRVS